MSTATATYLDAFRDIDIAPVAQAIWFTLARFQREGKEPGAEKWQNDTRRHRPQLLAAVWNCWSVSIGRDDKLFPWHDDYVIQGWVKCRKEPNATKRRICEALGIECPERWKRGSDETN